MSSSTPTIKLALLGAGNVGSQVARILLEDADSLQARIGARLELIGIAVRDLAAPRHYQADPQLYTTDAEALIDRADVVLELTGGIEPARSRILQALQAGKSVVSGNKALLAQHGSELAAAAAASGAQLSYEAAVGGAIPILRPLRDSLAGDRVSRVLGIVNGTTNYILDQMHSTGAQFDQALAEAQRLGYAEADPTADIEGHDAAAKAAILASLAFHSSFSLDQVRTEGITSISAEDVQAAEAEGYVIKLLAVCERQGDQVSLRVNPTLLPQSHPLASVRGAFNAVFVEAENAGELMFYGPGAGGAPTASAVLGDLVAIARRMVLGGPGLPDLPTEQLGLAGADQLASSYAVGMLAKDAPGTLSQIAQLFAEAGISIETIRQAKAPVEGGLALIRLVTHRVKDQTLRQTVQQLASLETVQEVTSLIQVEG